MMMPRTALTQLGKMVARDLTEGQMSGGLQTIGEALASVPHSIVEILDLMAAEARKKKPNHALIEAYGFMTGQALEILRYGVEQNASEAVQAVSAARTKLATLAQRGEITPDTLLLALRQFVSAKLELGDELRAATPGLFEHEQAAAAPAKLDIDRMLADMAKDSGGDVFGLQSELAERTSIFPEDRRVGIVAALLSATDPFPREAAIGWLLDQGAATRRDTASLLQQAAAVERVSPTMLRRLITIRNWVPHDDIAGVDAVIRACREKGIDCAQSAPAVVLDVLATAVDGSGAQSLFATVKDGRKSAVAMLLLKHGVGVRDAWVNAGLAKREAEGFKRQVESQIECFKTDLAQVRLALGHALAVSRETGVLPPFGLVDVAERIGMPAVNPEIIPTESLIAKLLAEMPLGQKMVQSVTSAVEASAHWEDRFPFMESWFEGDGAIDDLLGGKRLSAKRRTALILTEYLPSRRAHWAELLAWTALFLRREANDGWTELVLVAREIIDGRSLSEIPMMTWVAKNTALAAAQSRLF